MERESGCRNGVAEELSRIDQGKGEMKIRAKPNGDKEEAGGW
jgi:hypothetical protein